MSNFPYSFTIDAAGITYPACWHDLSRQFLAFPVDHDPSDHHSPNDAIAKAPSLSTLRKDLEKIAEANKTFARVEAVYLPTHTSQPTFGVVTSICPMTSFVRMTTEDGKNRQYLSGDVRKTTPDMKERLQRLYRAFRKAEDAYTAAIVEVRRNAERVR